MFDRLPPTRARALAPLLLLPLLAVPAPAEAGWSEALRDRLVAAGQDLIAGAEKAIVVGGVLIYRHRHTIAGATLGCAAGSLAGTASTLGAAPATGGASLSAVAPVAALGCGLGAAAGAALGYPLDRVYDAP